MFDQAESLRNLVHQLRDSQVRNTRVITVTSGKGGVGKSNFTLNFAISLKNLGYKVLVFDADIGLANIDVLMGMTPKYNLYHLLKREKTIWEIVQKGYRDVEFIAGGSGFHDLLQLSEEQLQYFIEQVEAMNGRFDFILFDTGAGLSKETLQFIVSAQEAIIVTTPEPTAITDAYAMIKMVHSLGHRVQFKLVVNRTANMREGVFTANKIVLVAKQFLDLDVQTLGFIPDDAHVQKAVKQQVPFVFAYPNCPAARAIQQLTGHFLTGDKLGGAGEKGGITNFLHRLIRLMK